MRAITSPVIGVRTSRSPDCRASGSSPSRERSAAVSESAAVSMGGIVPPLDHLPSRTVRAAPLIFLVLWSGGYAAAKVGAAVHGPVHVPRAALRSSRSLLLCDRSAGGRARARPGCTCWWSGSGSRSPTSALVHRLRPRPVGRRGRADHLAAADPGGAVRAAGDRRAGHVVRWVGLALGLAGAVIVIAARSTIEAESALGISRVRRARVDERRRRCTRSGTAAARTRYGERDPVRARDAVFVPVALLSRASRSRSRRGRSRRSATSRSATR